MIPTVRTALRQLPLATVWLLAAWPLVLWLVHRAEPETAVALAQRTAAALTTAALWTGLGAGLLCLVFPPARAGARLLVDRTWHNLTIEQMPLLRALDELRHLETAARHLEVGRLARQRNRGELAAFHLQRAIELDPGIASAWHQLGLALFRQHRWPEAAQAFQHADRLDPGHAFGDALLHAARALHQCGGPAALPMLQLHAHRHGGGPRSHVWLADALLRAGEPAQAREALRTAAAAPRQRQSAEDNWYRNVAWLRLRAAGLGR